MKVRRSIDVKVKGLGKKIKTAREALQIVDKEQLGKQRPLREIAALAGISRSHWIDIENEGLVNALPEETLRRIEKVLGVDLGVNFE